MKVALVYDRVNKWGGAEKVLLALHEIWPDAPLFTSVYEPTSASWAKDLEVRTSFIQKLPLPKNAHENYPFMMGLAFEMFNFDEFDLVISVTSEFGKAIVTKPKTLHICYCLNPTGYLWTGYDHYFSSKSDTFKSLSLPVVKYLRWYDKIVCHRPDNYIAISNVVSDRVKKYYGLKSAVIYPPVDKADGINVASPAASTNGDFYLIVSRLAPNKRLDIAINTFNKLGLNLKIVGVGKEEKRLKALSNRNIEYLGNLTDERLNHYYGTCRALIVPAEEDFGIVAVEAQSFGKPVVAYGRGGALETVVEGKTGWLFDSLDSESLRNTIVKSASKTVDPEECRRNARKFGKERFLREFKQEIEREYLRYHKE